MPSRVRKWGNSLGVRLPKALAEQAGVMDGTLVRVVLRKGRLVIERVPRAPLRLSELLDQVSDRNRPREVDTGPPVGREAW